MWVLLRPPRFGGANHASGYDKSVSISPSLFFKSTELMRQVMHSKMKQQQRALTGFLKFPPVPSRPISASTGRLICDDAFVLVACALQAHG